MRIRLRAILPDVDYAVSGTPTREHVMGTIDPETLRGKVGKAVF